jgi:hypothetical protein
MILTAWVFNWDVSVTVRAAAGTVTAENNASQPSVCAFADLTPSLLVHRPTNRKQQPVPIGTRVHSVIHAEEMHVPVFESLDGAPLFFLVTPKARDFLDYDYVELLFLGRRQ